MKELLKSLSKVLLGVITMYSGLRLVENGRENARNITGNRRTDNIPSGKTGNGQR